jgi:uncharacterized protein (TIGR03382 family)
MWQHVDDTPWDKVTGLEILTGNYNIGILAFFPRAIALWDMELAAGHQIAAIGGSDDHTAGMNETSTGSPIGSPTTLVLADNLSEAAIIDALKHGRTIVDLQGPDAPVLDFKLGTAEIGDLVVGSGHYSFTLHVTGGQGTSVELWKDGVNVEQRLVTSDDFMTVFDEDDEGTARWRIHLDQDGQPIVVTSHIYTSTAHDPGNNACGCQTTSSSSAAMVLGATVGLLRRRRRVT